MCSASEYSETSDLDNETVTIIIENDNFIVKKKLLTENSEYFSAMFNGNFEENSQKEIKIQIITSAAFRFLIDYFETKVIRLFNFNNICEIFDAVNYFNLESLQKLIIDQLLFMTDNESCFQIYQIAKSCNLSTIMPKVSWYILNNFSGLKNFIKNIPDLKSLFSYLSHENLNVTDEIDVFNAGCIWLKEHKQKDKILIVLSCIIFKHLDLNSLTYIRDHEYVKSNDTALGVVKEMHNLKMKNIIDKVKNRQFMDDNLDEIDPEVCEIIYNFLKSNCRKPSMKPCIVEEALDKYTIKGYNIEEKQVEEYKNWSFSNWWGLSIVPWNKFYIVVSCGVIRNITSNIEVWNEEIKVYNCLSENWRVLPIFIKTHRRHPITLIHNNVIYFFGGFGKVGLELNSADAYNLYSGEWKRLPEIPSTCSLGVAAVHKGNLYLSLDRLYVLQENCWKVLFRLRDVFCAMMSIDSELYFIQRYHNNLCFWDNFDTAGCLRPKLKLKKKFRCSVVGMCNIGKIVYVFGEGLCFQQVQRVESYNLDSSRYERTELLWTKANCEKKLYSITGAFLLPMFIEKDNYISTYGERWLIS